MFNGGDIGIDKPSPSQSHEDASDVKGKVCGK